MLWRGALLSASWASYGLCNGKLGPAPLFLALSLPSCTIIDCHMEQATNIDKRQFVTALREGDENAFEDIVRHYMVDATKIALSFAKDRDKADKAVFIAFCELWDNRDRIPEGASIQAYLTKWIREIIESSAFIYL